MLSGKHCLFLILDWIETLRFIWTIVLFAEVFLFFYSNLRCEAAQDNFSQLCIEKHVPFYQVWRTAEHWAFFLECSGKFNCWPGLRVNSRNTEIVQYFIRNQWNTECLEKEQWIPGRKKFALVMFLTYNSIGLPRLFKRKAIKYRFSV